MNYVLWLSGSFFAGFDGGLGSIFLIYAAFFYSHEIGKKNFFSDKKCILKGIDSKNKKLFKNWKANILHEQCNLNSVSKDLKINKASINSKNILRSLLL